MTITIDGKSTLAHPNRYAAIRLLPLLIFYILFISLFDLTIRKMVPIPWDRHMGDQVRYLRYSEHLTEGYFAAEDTNYLWSGPGYPLFLALFRVLHIPMEAARYLNAVFLWGALLFLFRILLRYMPPRRALFGAWCLGLYPPGWIELAGLLTEPLTLLLVCAGLYSLSQYVFDGRAGSLWTAGFCWGYLALVKVIFGYLIFAALVASLLVGVFRRTGRRAALMFASACLLCVPYLVYTYSLTGQVFYWSNAGGQALYWMTTPYAEEYGDWNSPWEAIRRPEYERHHDFVRPLMGTDFVQEEKAYKKKAIENIAQHPDKYAYNWLMNWSRIWFNFPYSYKAQTPYTLFFLVPNSILLITLLYCVYPYWKGRKLVRAEIWVFFGLGALYLGPLSLVGACARYLLPAAPILLIAIFYAAERLLVIRLQPVAASSSADGDFEGGS